MSALEDAQDAADEEPWGARGKVALARQALEEAQAHADARARATLEGRVTEARVKAAVLADAEVQRLKRELIALENEMRSGPVRRPPADFERVQRRLAAAARRHSYNRHHGEPLVGAGLFVCHACGGPMDIK